VLRLDASRNVLRPVALVAAAAGALTLVAACGSSSSSDKPTPSPSSAASSSSAPTSAPATSSAPAPTTAPTATTTTVAGPAGCTSNHLALQQGTSQGAAGSTIVQYILRNAGTAPCTLFGFPGVSFLNSAGTQVGSAATRQGAATPAVTVQPGQVASFTVQIAIAGCATSAVQSQTIRVFPPNNTAALEAPGSYPICTAPSVTSVKSGLTAQ
jgi:hypothetical protein